MNRFLVVILFSCLSYTLVAQNTRSTDTPRPPLPSYQSSKKEKKSIFAFLKKEKKTNKNEVAEFRARLQKVYKQKAKEEKKMEKPRYSDPSYFGHKKPPKKRKPGKQKFCKVCRIKH